MQRRAPEFCNAPTQPAPLDLTGVSGPQTPATAPAPAPAGVARRPGRGLRQSGTGGRRAAASRTGACPLAPPRSRLSHLEMPMANDFSKACSASDTEVAHDPDLDGR